MPATPMLTQTWEALKAMDKQIMEAESHLRVAQSINHPQALKFATDLEKAKQQRQEMMNAIEKEMNR